MLLVRIKVLIERCRWQTDSFRNKRSEEYGDLAHARYVFAVHWLEIGKVGGGGPLCGCKEVSVERFVWSAYCVVGREVDLFAVVYRVGCDFGIETGIT